MKRRMSFSILAFGSLAGTLFAQEIPLTNWTVPPFTQSSSGGITTMTDVTPPRVFIGVQPCRLVDTRGTPGFPAGFGAPSLSPGVPRNFDLDNGPCPGLPAGIAAYSLNITVVNTAGPGHLVIYPQGGAQPTVSSINYVAGQTIANAVIVPAGTGGGVTVIAGVSSTNLLIDINGYFADTLGNPANSLLLGNNNPGGATALFINSATAGNSWGVRALQGAGFPIPSYVGAAVRGESATNGVLGISQQIGVAGSLLDGGGGERAYGLSGFHDGGAAIGAYGLTYATAINNHGVKGVGGGGVVVTFIPSSFRGGVRGESDGGSGVLGITNTGSGVAGAFLNNTGQVVSFGILGCSATEGLCAQGSSSVTGTSSFVEPHPRDPSKSIRYVSLEGNEAGTYFRGRGKFENGLAVIPVPHDFQIVTDPEGLSIQVTPIGETANVAIREIGLERIVVKGTRDVEFFYLVHGVRHSYRDVGPIAENEFFRPSYPEEPLPAYLPEALKQRLIANGTYHADGKVNLETARRLGWDKMWEQRSPPAPQPADP